MRRRRHAVLAACAAVTAALAAAASPAAAAPCQSSSQTIQTFPETTGDAGGIAPDITETVIATDNACHLTVRFTVDRPALVDGDVLTWYLDADGNAGTGDIVNGGAEYKIVLTGRSAPTPDDPPTLSLHTSGVSYAFVKNIVARGGTGFNVVLRKFKKRTARVKLTLRITPQGAAEYSIPYRLSRNVRLKTR